MSTWRLRGYVQDSDEEEEDTEVLWSSNCTSSRKAESERVTPAIPRNTHTENAPNSPVQHVLSRSGPGVFQDSPVTDVGNQGDLELTPHAIEAFSQRADQQCRTESPDPLQSSPAVRTQGASLQLPAAGAPIIQRTFDLDLLSNSSQSDDVLSDPPSDIERDLVFASPRRHTEVQVIIPHAHTPEHIVFENRVSRAFRTRKPIQLHPYLLEGERYRRDCQVRGIRPVPKLRSPPQEPRQQDEESQEQEFDPGDQSPTTSTRRDTRPSSTGQIIFDDERNDTAPDLIVPSLEDTELRVPAARKKRKSNRSVLHPLTKRYGRKDNGAVENHVTIRPIDAADIYAVPQSPPYSSSPRGQRHTPVLPKPLRETPAAPLPSLPTPSNSSTTRDDIQPTGQSDSDQDVGTRRVAKFQPIVLSSDSSATSSGSERDSDDEGAEVKEVVRRMKGVLPASWLRLDRQAQEKRKAKANKFMASTHAAERPEAQRGIAQRISNRRKSTEQLSPQENDDNVVVVSDDSDHNTEFQRILEDNRMSSHAAIEPAATFDGCNTDDDLASMENDHLHLFTIGGQTKKRKRQRKLTDTLSKQKKPRFSDEGRRSQKSTRLSKQRYRHQGGSMHRRSSPPALSIVDLDQSASKKNTPTPQFIKLAMRTAQRLSDLGRQRPHNKHVRLQTSRDTEDAIETLRHWREGGLKPKASSLPKFPLPSERAPLADRVDNQQRAIHPPLFPRAQHDLPRAPKTQQSLRPRERKYVAERIQKSLGVPLESRSARGESSRSRTSGFRPIHRELPSFRAAQLEDLESKFGSSHRKVIFERGLQRADQHFEQQLSRWEPKVNLQLARFLADDDAVLPLPPPANERNQFEQPSAKPDLMKKRRLARKSQAKRIDTDSREYRQPSEPAVQDLLHGTLVEETLELQPEILQDLGPFGTKYPTSFDVSPLALGTYFQSSTFVGSEEFLRSLLTAERNLDVFSGHFSLFSDTKRAECGPWSDETYSQIIDLLEPLFQHTIDTKLDDSESSFKTINISTNSIRILRSLVSYISTHLSFVDTIDRQDFAIRMLQLLQKVFETALQASLLKGPQSSVTLSCQQRLRIMAYLLVLSMQIHLVAQHPIVECAIKEGLSRLIRTISRTLVTHIVRKSVHDLGCFLERNKKHRERESGITDDDIIVECIVICMHVLGKVDLPGAGFWDLVAEELTPQQAKTTLLSSFESTWATLFILLPFVELDASGILIVHRRYTLANENWNLVKELLKRLFILYPATRKSRTSSLNEYVRATLTRCHVLIHFWHWRKCEPILNTIFDFFGKNGLGQLPHEQGKGSPRFLQNLTGRPNLDVELSDTAFHIFLKILALGLHGMKQLYTEKKLRSIVFRCTPNHGRSYPKDSTLDQESLNALRNHHDLLCTLYWASPPDCRPKLDLIKNLVQHESSHREACRLNVRAWANLATFQLSADEPYSSLEPFSQWHKEIMQQTLKQYRLAKIEAEEYLNSAKMDGTSDISTYMVQTTIDKNQSQVIATLRDCIAGMKNAIQQNPSLPSLKIFLVDSGIMQLLELAHVEDPRLTLVIRETLAVLREYGTLQNQTPSGGEDQSASEESQDYGTFPDMDDLSEPDQHESISSPLDFAQMSLWHLLSNAFGADRAPDDNLLLECIDTWVLMACCQVSSGTRSWSYFIDSFSEVSWHRLRGTDQTRKFWGYFAAKVLESDPSAFKGHQQEFITTLLISLADRESMLRFQHRLLLAIFNADPSHPLLKNLPFVQKGQTGGLDITLETMRIRRTALISSLLANMRDAFHSVIRDDPESVNGAKHEYAAMLKSFMTAMKNNYQQLGQGSLATGAYVEFVQQIIQLLTQYASEICTVHSFFTDSASFPLPAADPTYVVGRLCGYASKLSNLGVVKQLSTFVQTVSQKAALDNQQPYLVNQLSTALSGRAEEHSNISALRTVLLQGVFPAYIDAAYDCFAGFVIAKPILECLPSVVESMIFEIKIMDDDSVECICSNIWGIAHAFIKGVEALSSTLAFAQQPYFLRTITLLIETMQSALPILKYIRDRTSTSSEKPFIISYVSQLTVFVARVLHDMEGDVILPLNFVKRPLSQYASLLSYSSEELGESLKGNWNYVQGSVYFGQGFARREVIVDVGSYEEERMLTTMAIERWHQTVSSTFD